ncbi:MAG TPA: c-type cytochrome biogenesis protein CcmI [Moraxellaceae bacterium]|nr:c-type cytochrome biogenesis protein CcmI [Moraxellaceae bacterium]
MTILFWALAVALSLLAAAAIVWPLWRNRHGDAGQDLLALNRRVFRERLAELERDRAEGRTDEATFVELRTELERNMLTLEPAVAEGASARFSPRVVSVLVLLALPLMALGFYRYAAAPQGLGAWWELREEMGPSVDKLMRGEPPSEADARAHTIADFVRLLQDRLQREPKNDEGWFMLGVAYMQLEMVQPASTAFEHAWRLRPSEPRYALLYAQTRIFANQGQLDPLTRRLLDEVLAGQPGHEGALVMYGLAAYQGGDYATAAARLEEFQRHRAARGAPAGSPMVAQVSAALADARARLKASASGQVASRSGGITVKVRVDRAVAGRFAPGDTLYVFAKPLAGPPMPLAVVRRGAGELPLTLELDDSQSMMPQRPLSSVREVAVSARISRHGGPDPQPGDLEAVAVPVRQGGQHQTVELVIQSVR